jgi:hypothetical protein
MALASTTLEGVSTSPFFLRFTFIEFMLTPIPPSVRKATTKRMTH